MSLTVYLNGKYINEKEAKVSAFDSAFLYGDGVFESLRVYKGKNKFFREHYERLLNSSKCLGYSLKLTFEELVKIISKLINLNNLYDAYIRITITRGNSKIGFGKSLSDNQTIFIIAKKHKQLDRKLYQEGIKLVVADTRRNAPEAVNPQIKSISNLNSLLGKLEIKAKQVFEVIMLNTKDFVTECAAANIFWIKDSKIYTPDVSTGLLEGVTRNTIINICEHELNYEVNKGHFNINDVLSADEVFLTSTSLEVMPVKQINETIISNGFIGEMTKSILAKFKESLA